MKQIKLSDTHYIVVDDNGTRTYSTLEIKGVGYYPLSLAKEIAGEVDVENKDKKYTEEDMRKALSQAFFAAQ